MTVHAVAMTEVQEDSVLSESDACNDWDKAVDVADSFMLRCVGDFYEIDPADVEARRAKLEERVLRDFSSFCNRGKKLLNITYEDGDRGLVLSACVREVELS